jgi:hypothetical protein
MRTMEQLLGLSIVDHLNVSIKATIPTPYSTDVGVISDFNRTCQEDKSSAKVFFRKIKLAE